MIINVCRRNITMKLCNFEFCQGKFVSINNDRNYVASYMV